MEEKKRIVLAADHAGYLLKNEMAKRLAEAGYPVENLGTDTAESCDYPVYAEKLCRALQEGRADLGILVCGTGVSMSIAANKFNGIRAACCSDVYSTKFTRLHNDANVLCMGARVIGEGLAWILTQTFVETEFEGGKHARRIGLIAEIEQKER